MTLDVWLDFFLFIGGEDLTELSSVSGDVEGGDGSDNPEPDSALAIATVGANESIGILGCVMPRSPVFG